MSKRWSRGSSPEAEHQVVLPDPLVGKVRAYIVDLVEPWSEKRRQVDESTGKVLKIVRVTHPSLLEQLDGAIGSTAGVSSSAPRSKPPASLEATSLLGEIAAGTDVWARKFLSPAFLSGVQAGADSRVRQVSVLLDYLGRRASLLSTDHLEALSADVLTWWAHARIVSSWDVAPIKPHVPCAECGTVGKLQVRLDPTSAVCLECRAAWDSTTIGTLGDQIQMMLDLARPPVDVVGAVVDARRGTGRAGPWETPTSGDVLLGVGPDRGWHEPDVDLDTPALDG